MVAIDETGRQLAEKTIAATTPAGHLELLPLGGALAASGRWALEDCRHLTRRLEADLRARRRVGRAGPAQAHGRRPPLGPRAGQERPDRRPRRRPGRPARARPAGGPLDGPERELRLLVDHREDLVGERTGHQQRLRWFLSSSPIAEPAARSLDRARSRTRSRRALADRAEPVARFARDLLVADPRADARPSRPSSARSTRWSRPLAPDAPGPARLRRLTAAKLVGETAGIGRFRSKAAFARHNGTAPVPVWSGNVVRHRLNRGGNRQLNVALHRIAITQIRLDGPGRDYLDHRHRRRRHPDRGDPRPPTPDQRRGLPTPAGRRSAARRACRCPAGRGLT